MWRRRRLRRPRCQREDRERGSPACVGARAAHLQHHPAEVHRVIRVQAQLAALAKGKAALLDVLVTSEAASSDAKSGLA